MNDLTYACTSVVVTMKDGSERIYQVGQVLRPARMAPSFSDMILLGFSDPKLHGDIYVKVARPFASATCIGTTGPGVALQVETFTLTMTQLLAYTLVDDGSIYVLGGVTRPVERPYESEHLTYTVR